MKKTTLVITIIICLVTLVSLFAVNMSASGCEHNNEVYKHVASTDTTYHSCFVYCADCGEYLRMDAYPHDIVNGVCTLCGYGCFHSFSGDTCSTCGYKCVHYSYEYIYTPISTSPNYHSVKVACSVCGVRDYSNPDNGAHLKCAFDENGICRYCDRQCPHINFGSHNGVQNDQRCTTCGYKCPHSERVGDYMTCVMCGLQCIHPNLTITFERDDDELENHSLWYTCTDCGYKVHDVSPHVWNGDNICDDCGFSCSHTSMDYHYIPARDGCHYTAYCKYCDYYDLSSIVKHEYADTTCKKCGYTCDHSNGYTEEHVKAEGEYQFHTRYYVCLECNTRYNGTAYPHEWNGDDTCDLCSFTCYHVGHTSEDGICNNCKCCIHTVTDFKIIGTLDPDGHIKQKYCVTCSANIGDGVLVAHSFNSEGACSCGYGCTHNNVNEIISSSDDGCVITEKCNDCLIILSTVTEDHIFADRTCSRCGYTKPICNHVFSVDTRRCNLCGELCPHEFYGVSTITTKYVSLGVSKHQKQTVCSACLYVTAYENEAHTLNEYGECSLCNYEHVHVWKDGVCSSCKTVCAHNYENGKLTCSICGKRANTVIETDDSTLGGLFFAIYDAQAMTFFSMLDYNILGVNIASLVVSLVVLAVVIFILKKVK